MYTLLKLLKKMFPPGLEPGTFRVLGERDNRYTTETYERCEFYQFIKKIRIMT